MNSDRTRSTIRGDLPGRKLVHVATRLLLSLGDFVLLTLRTCFVTTRRKRAGGGRTRNFRNLAFTT